MRKVQVLDYNLKEVETREIPKMEIKTRKILQKRLSPDFDASLKYIPRSERQEWHVVGLLGVVRIIPKSSVNPRWIKISDGLKYDLWLIR